MNYLHVMLALKQQFKLDSKFTSQLINLVKGIFRFSAWQKGLI